ncbi:hypothetical protein RB195_009399 [Necator americanus]|uniref:Uncharacterized protein n=1 Tax=Necator americanus TaxID=51031 RepID=A0ABR1CT63_NECAM
MENTMKSEYCPCSTVFESRHVSILSYEYEITARRTLEAFWITTKSPKMNKKDECIAITNELSVYQDLCVF